MQDLLANVDHIKFDLEIAVEQQLGAQPLPFPGMDKSGSAVCEFFMRAACIKGPDCRHRHTRRVICVNYLVGFCPEGKSCKFMHPRFELPMGASEQPPLPQQTQNQTKPVPTIGRSSLSLIQLTNSSPGQRPQNHVMNAGAQQNNMTSNRGPRPLDQVTCYKCGEKGHYANKCTKGHLAFLSGQ
eukprot:superscaffoldBa00000213_g2779